jgi:hypothetical protein
MNTEDEITKLKKRITALEETIQRILPLGDELERRMKILEDTLQPSPSQNAPTTQG